MQVKGKKCVAKERNGGGAIEMIVRKRSGENVVRCKRGEEFGGGLKARILSSSPGKE